MSGGPDRPFQVGDTVQVRTGPKAVGGKRPRPVKPHQHGDVGLITQVDRRNSVVYVRVPYRAPCSETNPDASDGAGVYYYDELDLLKPSHPE